MGEYSISAFTSSAEDNAAFDGDVYVKLTGAYGTTDEILLCNETTVRLRGEGAPNLFLVGSALYQSL